MASSVEENIFACEIIKLDFEVLLPVEPQVKTVNLVTNFASKTIKIICKNILEASPEEREIIIKWDAINNITITSFRKCTVKHLIFNLNKTLCGYDICCIYVSNTVFNDLYKMLTTVYSDGMNEPYNISDAIAQRRIKQVFVLQNINSGHMDNVVESLNSSGSVNRDIVLRNSENDNSDAAVSEYEYDFDSMTPEETEACFEELNNRSLFVSILNSFFFQMLLFVYLLYKAVIQIE